MVQVLDALADEHALMNRVLSVLEWEINRATAGGGPDFRVIAPVLDYFMGFPDLCHHPKEDLIFRKLEERDRERARAVGDLVAEHDGLATLVHKLAFTATRRALDDPAAGDDEIAGADTAWFISMARNMIDAHREHMRLEDQTFFPAARDALKRADWDWVEARVRRHEEIFGCDVIRERVEAGFDALIRRMPEC